MLSREDCLRFAQECDEMSKVVQEVPFLSKIPFLGELFRTTSTDHRHSEIMVFITPHIVK